MKKLIFCGSLFICLIFISQAQTSTNFGVKAGFNFTFFNVDESSFGINQSSETGFYGGVFVDFEIDEGFSIQPEMLYIGLNDFDFINAPIYVKYEVVNNLNILVGPSINYFFDFFSNKLKVRADLSTSYDVTPAFDIHLKYTIGLEPVTPNGLFIGLGYVL